MTVTMKVLGAAKDRADANIYRDGEKIGEVKLLSGDGLDLLELLGSEWIMASGWPGKEAELRGAQSEDGGSVVEMTEADRSRLLPREQD